MTNWLNKFYHIKNLQSTKTVTGVGDAKISFITLRIYKVLKPVQDEKDETDSFITLRIYKVLKPWTQKGPGVSVLSH